MPIIVDQAPPPQIVQPAAVSNVTTPDWVAKPTGEDMARLMPTSAQQVNLEGVAVMQCVVSLEGKLADCTVAFENPTDAGFGVATLQLAPLFKMRPLDRDSRPVAGRPIKIPVRWVVPGRVQAKPTTMSLPGLAGHVELDCRAAASGHFDNCLVLQTSGGAPLSDAAIEALGKVRVPAGTQPWLRVVLPIEITTAPPKR